MKSLGISLLMIGLVISITTFMIYVFSISTIIGFISLGAILCVIGFGLLLVSDDNFKI